MKVADMHLDVADLAYELGFGLESFMAQETAAPVSFSKLREAEIALAGFTLYCDKSLLETSYYDLAHKLLGYYQDLQRLCPKLYQVRSSGDLNDIAADQTAFILTLEGCECLRTPDDWDEFYGFGVRSLGLTWNNDNQYACGQSTLNDIGLSPLGESLLARVRSRGGVPVDLSHLSRQSIRDVARSWDGPIYASHSNSQAICNHPRNLRDEEIQLIVERQGLVGLFFYGPCVGPNNSFEDLWKHVDYLGERFGLEHLAFSSDIYPLSQFPFINGYTDLSIWRGLKDFLATKLTEEQMQKLLWGNWLKYFESVLP